MSGAFIDTHRTFVDQCAPKLSAAAQTDTALQAHTSAAATLTKRAPDDSMRSPRRHAQPHRPRPVSGYGAYCCPVGLASRPPRLYLGGESVGGSRCMPPSVRGFRVTSSPGRQLATATSGVRPSVPMATASRWAHRGARQPVCAGRSAGQDGVGTDRTGAARLQQSRVRAGESAPRHRPAAHRERFAAPQHGDDGARRARRWPSAGSARSRRAAGAAGCGVTRLGRRRGGGGIVGQ